MGTIFILVQYNFIFCKQYNIILKIHNYVYSIMYAQQVVLQPPTYPLTFSLPPASVNPGYSLVGPVYHPLYVQPSDAQTIPSAEERLLFPEKIYFYFFVSSVFFFFILVLWTFEFLFHIRVDISFLVIGKSKFSKLRKTSFWIGSSILMN